jgi:hypothetical protein
MIRKLILSTLFLTGFMLSAQAKKAVADTVVANAIMTPVQPATAHLRISLLTCGVGEELYASFGHTAVRIVDSLKGIDAVYNYGTFSFDDDFYPKFVRGKLPYYVSKYSYDAFLEEYTDERRYVDEQLLLITDEQKRKIQEFLEWNALPENREYKYDFLFDNCATRIRDIFPKTLGGGFMYPQLLPKNERLSFRNMIDHYLAEKHWERLGIDLCLGSRIDVPMKNEDVMFLPDYLRDGLAGATLNARKVAAPVKHILPGAPQPTGVLNTPFIIFAIICMVTMLGVSVPSLRAVGKIMSFILLFISGLLGVFFLFMWLGTDHQTCENNYNVLWALPTNLLIVFRKFKGIGKYCILAMGLIGVSLLLHILKIQELPLLELGPILLSLVFIYGTIYKRSKVVAKAR